MSTATNISTVRKYRKRPVVVEAERFDGSAAMAQRYGLHVVPLHEGRDAPLYFFLVRSRVGKTRIREGDWIVSGPKGELGVCQAELFEATYEEVSPAARSLGVAAVLDAVEAVLQDDEVDLSDVDSPAKAKTAQLELVAHIRDQLVDVLRAEEERAGSVKAHEDALRAARAQLEAVKIQVGRLLETLVPFADHGHPADWRGRPTDEEVHVIVGYPMDHVILVSDLLRAHAVYHDVRKESGR